MSRIGDRPTIESPYAEPCGCTYIQVETLSLIPWSTSGQIMATMDLRPLSRCAEHAAPTQGGE